jgi:centrosomal protein CEP104
VKNYDEIQVGRHNPTNQMLNEYPDEDTAKRYQQNNYDDDRPIPTVQKGIKDFNAHLEDQIAKEGMGGIKNEPTQEESFSKKQLSKMNGLTGISREILEQVFSSNWHTREIGLEILLQEIDDWNANRISPPSKVLISNDKGECLENLWEVNNMFLEERISQLLIKGIMMLSKLILLRMDHAPESSIQVLSKLLDHSMMKILEKFGDYKNESLREKLSQLISDIVEADLLSFAEMSDWLMKSKGLPRALNSFKHLIGKLMALKDLIGSFEGQVSSCFRVILGYCCKCLENSNSEVRGQANNVIVEVYRVIGGQKVNQYLNQTKIRKNHYENLKREFRKIDESSLAGSGNSSIRHSQDIVSPPEKSKFAQEKPKKKTRPPPQAEKACNFCKQSSPAFLNDNDYDMHLWQDCPMLITCEQCTQVVEIADFTEHLLEECSNSQDFKECPRCRLAIDVESFDNHMNSNECEMINEDSITCPLCLEVLEVVDDDLEKAWFEHLILNRCPKNTRSVD